MKLPAIPLLLTALACSVHGHPITPTAGGTGPYPATYTTEPTLTNHTIYLPAHPLPARAPRLPILIWGEGGCQNNGTRFAPFLTEIASHGYLVLASGPPNGTGMTSSQMMRDAILWASAKASSACGGVYAHVDASRIAVAGQSCGGLETYQMREDERVTGLGIFNSGLVAPGSVPDLPDDGNVLEDPSVIGEVHKPVFWFLGGDGDVAYPNGMRDYAALAGQPKWVGNYPVGHSGTYTQPNGGVFGVAAVKWLEFLLRGNKTTKAFFVDGGAEKAGWEETASEGLDAL
ncbi:Alpha/Beta hydrolase protein [Aspergillus heterothallicus]